MAYLEETPPVRYGDHQPNSQVLHFYQAHVSRGRGRGRGRRGVKSEKVVVEEVEGVVVQAGEEEVAIHNPSQSPGKRRRLLPRNQHYEGQQQNRDRYAAAMAVLQNNGVDIAQNWFLEYCYGGPAPEGSMVQRCCNVTAENVNSLIQEFPIPYTHVKSHLTALTNESKARTASYEKKLDTVIWWYDELKCTEVDEVITRRVQAGEEITLPNGKLLERLLEIKMY
ncbi:hypothetical protein DPMN_145909 [Dreissena polymorpha]|uniref:Uncharacterized protein n=1 Tax=Dreissena polymorpha TaxID=45954 RepID=A0A9D4F5R4_DREPO|nr:hypothetical protein DPMN_145909 [Dreissena polymorpha]